MPCAVRGDNGGTFRFGTMSWKRCSAGFHDMLFPEVCADVNQNRVAFTVECSWLISESFQGLGTMLPNGLQEVDTFLQNLDTTSLPNRALTVNRLWCGQDNQGHTICAVLRGIGYRIGIDVRSTLAVDESVQPTAAQDANLGAICATSTDLQSSRPSCASVSSYTFRIDRISNNTKDARDFGNIVYARYSFDILFPGQGDYTVFFEGCCRSNDLYNNQQLPFHLRAGVRLYHESSIPWSSPHFAMPDCIYLLQGERTGSNATKCLSSSSCSGNEGCDYLVTLQAWFSDDRFFSPLEAGQDPDAGVSGNNGVYFSEGTADEMGYYWCLANLALDSQVYNPPKCQDGADAFRPPQSAQSTQMLDYGLTDPKAGNLTLSARSTGLWTTTVMACLLVDSVEACIPLDCLLAVDSNALSGPRTARPPFADVSVPVVAGGIAPTTTRSSPVHVLCGTSTWISHSQQISGTALQAVFTNYDQWPTSSTCQGHQAVGWVEQANSLPYGVQVAAKSVALAQTPATSFLTVRWRPMCENPSHIGLFMFCFRANNVLQPGTSGAGLVPFISLPSAPREDPQAAPCDYVRVDGPTFPSNPSLTLQLCLQDSVTAETTCSALPDPVCSGECCYCCSDPNCECEVPGKETNCCPQIYVPLQKKAVMLFRASTVDPSYLFSLMSFQFQYDQANFLSGFMPANGSYPPCFDFSSSCKGCTGPGAVCQPPSAPYTATDVGYFNWSLVQTSAFTVDEQRSLAQAKRVCVEVVKAVPDDIDQNLWATYYPANRSNSTGRSSSGTFLRGFEPSCSYCFALRGAGVPFFVTADPVTQPNGTNTAAELNFIVGTEGSIFLMGASAITPTPFILLESSLPNGATLERQSKVQYFGVPSGFATQRKLKFLPKQGQEGNTYRICFSVYDGVNKSPFTCYSLTVVRAKVTWMATAWPALKEGGLIPLVAAAGCKYQYKVYITSQYKLSVGMQALPQIPVCSATLNPSGIECFKLGGSTPQPTVFAGADGVDFVGVIACATISSPLSHVAATVSGPGCCGDGRCNGAEARSNCPADCTEDDGVLLESGSPVLITGNQSSNAGEFGTEANFTWIPTPGLAGRAILLCLAAVLQGGSGLVSQVRIADQGPTLCLLGEVQRCQYCVQYGSSMQDVGKFLLSTSNWPLLYNANPTIERPNSLLANSSILSLGPVYSVQPGESLLSIAGVNLITFANNPYLEFFTS